MMRFALVNPGRQYNAAYRAFLPGIALEDRGHRMQVLRGKESEVVQLVRRQRPPFDVAHVHRWYLRPTQRMAEALRAAGTAVVWDNDDELTDVPSDASGRRNRGGLKSQQIEAGMRRMVALADLVTTTNPVLAETFRRYGASHVRVIENYLPMDFPDVHRPERPGVMVGWTAGGEHDYDLERLGLRDVLRRLIDAHPDVTVASIGVDLGLRRDRYVHNRGVHYTSLHRAVASFDIGIAPLADHPFNLARSNVKVKEYAAAGTPWLASDLAPYQGLGERQGGRLVSDDRWYEELERLVVDHRARRKLAKAARAWGRTQIIDRNSHLWEQAYAEAIELARERRAGPLAGARAADG